MHLVRSMKIRLSSPNLQFRVGPGSEVSSPVISLLVSIWEHISGLDWVAKILLLESVQVSARSRVKHCDVWRVVIKVLDEPIH